MKSLKNIELDFVVDKLTNSIENLASGDSFPTEISILTSNDLKKINTKTGWKFDWSIEFHLPEREVYKLTISNNPHIVQGLVSLEVKRDHVFMHLIESAPFNVGETKTYIGVPGNLVAFACKLSFQRGNEGFVSFIAKSNLIKHYQRSLGANRIGDNLMIIDTVSAMKLINKYFKE